MKISIPRRELRRVRKGNHRLVRDSVCHQPKVIYNRKEKYGKRSWLDEADEYFDLIR